MARMALAAGHDVTCVARGDDLPTGAVHVRADRDTDDALAGVADSRWDVVIDVARQPGHVRRAVRDLAPAAERFVFVSSTSAYVSHSDLGADEDAALHPPLPADEMSSPDDYGAAKAAGERAVLDGFGAARALIVRPGLVGGPGDPSGRTGYWGSRLASPSNVERRVLVPDAPQLPTAVIDVRDLAGWLVHAAGEGRDGIFNAGGEPMLFPAHLEVARRIAGHDGPLELVGEDWLIEHGVAQWSGPRSLPLWIADRSWYGMNARSSARARAAGLALRPLEETIADSLRWDLDHANGPGSGAGLTDDEERALLAAWRREARGAKGETTKPPG